MTRLKKLVFLVSAVLSSALTLVFAQEKNTTLEAKNLSGNVVLFVGNDLGRNGYHQQKPIAELMGELADALGPEAVLALGDIHHYLGVQSVNDPLWMTNYELIYAHPELQVEWCPVLGNHEYSGNTQAVIDYTAKSRRWSMPARYYVRMFDHHGTKVKVVFLDTPPLIDKYRNNSSEYPDAGKQNTTLALQWLDSVLSVNDQADWTIVAGHHPIYAQTGKNSSERTDMQTRVDPLLRKHKVDMYLCGHIHNFQHIRQKGSDVDYVVNSSGSLSRKNVKETDGTVFCSGEEGFSILTADKTSLTLSMVDAHGKILHQVKRKK